MAGKSILVVDTPKDCSECRLNSHTEYDFDVCWVTQGKGGCPLKPLPDRAEVDEDSYGIVRLTEESFAYGWNACLEDITE